MANRDSTKTDFSSFMCIILMLTGALVTILISNVIVVAANPQNVEITSIVSSDFTDEGKGEKVEVIGGNLIKNPWYVEVQRDHLVVYPGETLINLQDLEEKGNQFEQLLARIEPDKETQYIVLLIRPYASSIARQLKKIIQDRGLDVGIDLLEKDLPIIFSNTSTNVLSSTSQ